MKVVCKCCHKAFDYDMYMGLCPKCGRVYRRGKGVYSAVEKDMVGDFHLHADDGGLNRGIHGVIYNQGSSETVINRPVSNKTTVDTLEMSAPAPARPAVVPKYGTVSKAAIAQASSQISSQATPRDVAETIRTSTKNGYYAPNHKTKMNQAVVNNKKQGSSLGVIVFIIIIIISIVSSILD